MNLYIWIIVAHAAHNLPHYGWQFAGQYDSAQACHRAADALGVKNHRCIGKATGEPL